MSDLSDRLQRLRGISSDLRASGVEERISTLVAWAQAWCDPRDRYRREAVSLLPASTGLSPAMVERGISLGFESVEAHRLRAWFEREAGRSPAAQLSAHISSSNVFIAGLPPIVASLLAGVPVFIRPPQEQTDFARLLVASWCERSLLGGLFLDWSSWPREDESATRALLAATERSFVFGTDETLTAVRCLAPPEHRVLGFGHRLSFAAVGREALDEQATWDSTWAALAQDVLAWDGAGCLTPRWIFVEGDGEAAQLLARRAAPFLARLAEELPRGRSLDAAAGSRRATYLATAAFGGYSKQGRGWAVAAPPEWSPRPDPPARTAVFVPVPDLSKLPSLLAPLGDHLQGMAYVGAPERRESLASSLSAAGLSMSVPAGMIQRPPIDWNHDGVRLLADLY